MVLVASAIGVHRISDDLVDLYVNDVFVSRWRNQNPRTWGSGLTVGNYGDPDSPHYSLERLECWTEPGGTLLFAEEFLDWSAWGVAHFENGSGWGISPVGRAYAGTGSGMANYLLANQPVGTTYVRVVNLEHHGAPGSFLLQHSRRNGNDGMLGYAPSQPPQSNSDDDNYGAGFYVSMPTAAPIGAFDAVRVTTGWQVGSLSFG